VTTGTVYTPDWVAKQMVYVLLKNHMKLNHNAFDIEGVNFDALYLNAYIKGHSTTALDADTWLQILLPLSILDLSCGSGVLLIAYLEFIEFLIKQSCQYSNENLCNLIQHQIVGFDIDPEAVRVFRHILSEFSESRGIGAMTFRIFCGNSLIEDLIDASERFDLVIGNPPYIGEKNNLEWFAPIKQTKLGATYYEGKMDYFYFFIYKGHSFLKDTGSMCYISSNYFLTADGAKKLRRFIKDDLNLSTYIDYGDVLVFPERKLHACVYVLQKVRASHIQIYDETLTLKKRLTMDRIFQTDGTIQFILSDETQAFLTKMSRHKVATLGACYDIHQGIVSGSDKQFVYHESVIDTLPQTLKPYLVPFFKNSDVHHYYTTLETSLYLLYIDHMDVHEDVLNWLQPYKDKLMKRREVIKNIRAWYMLTWPRTRKLFTSEKIVVPQRAKSNRFAYVTSDFHASADVYYITERENSPYSLQVLAMILNSSLTFQWLSHMGKKKGALLELYATPLKSIPIPILDSVSLRHITALSDELYSGVLRPNADRIEVIKKDVDVILNEVLTLSV
jgi:adenine-specific DNA-methyltransferase